MKALFLILAIILPYIGFLYACARNQCRANEEKKQAERLKNDAELKYK